MYLTVDQSIVAIDAVTCRERWTYNWRVKGQVLSPVNRGAALKTAGSSVAPPMAI
jgi:alcohol dehydrogenase (cytochrome c)